MGVGEVGGRGGRGAHFWMKGEINTCFVKKRGGGGEIDLLLVIFFRLICLFGVGTSVAKCGTFNSPPPKRGKSGHVLRGPGSYLEHSDCLSATTLFSTHPWKFCIQKRLATLLGNTSSTVSSATSSTSMYCR